MPVVVVHRFDMRVVLKWTVGLFGYFLRHSPSSPSNVWTIVYIEIYQQVSGFPPLSIYISSTSVTFSYDFPKGINSVFIITLLHFQFIVEIINTIYVYTLMYFFLLTSNTESDSLTWHRAEDLIWGLCVIAALVQSFTFKVHSKDGEGCRAGIWCVILSVQTWGLCQSEISS